MTLRLAAAGAAALLMAGCGGEPTSPPAPSDRSPAGSGDVQVVDTIATGLSVPWGLDFLPGGDAVVTERDSRRVLRVTPEGEVSELGVIDVARAEGEGGLLGVAVSPDFADDHLLYLYATTASDNRLLRVSLDGDRLGAPEVLLDGIPSAFIHDGGRLAFGPDGFLYVSTGESGEPALAQDRGSLGGKILRLTRDGAPAPGNPFGDEIWTWGHRNVQGLAFDDQGRLFASEFGQSSFDEFNRIEKGANYGWPDVEGTGGEGDGFTDPLFTWDVADASPSGLAFLAGSFWMASLRGERLWQIPADGGEPTAHFVGRSGRMRTVVAAPDGSLWVTTSNRDGRGSPADEDDQILRVSTP